MTSELSEYIRNIRMIIRIIRIALLMSFLGKIFPPKADPPRAEKRKESAEEKTAKELKKEKKVERKEAVRNVVLPAKEKGDYAYGVLLAPHVTEKSTNGNALNKYVFRVQNTANKPEIKKAVEGKYGVNVLNVRVLNTKPKRVRLGRIEGVRPGYKKAIITLQQGDKIEIGV